MSLTKLSFKSFRLTLYNFVAKFTSNDYSMAEAGVAAFDKEPSWWSSKVTPWLSWKRTSIHILAFVEQKLFSCLKQPLEGRYILISNGQKRIWTVSLNANASGTPLVMVHGMGSGVGLWVLNLDSLSRNRPVYAIDLLGFGRSSRTKFSSDPTVAEQEFVESIEEWRKAMNLDKIILLGHSLGGYLSACYSMSYPQHIKHLILVDPWGLPERPPDTVDVRRQLPVWARVVATIIEPFNPFTPLRAAGPWGPALVAKFRGDLIRKYAHLYSDNRIADYIFHCNAQHPSGETAFKTLMHQFGWAKFPILPRVNKIAPELSMTLIHGARSWVDYNVGYQVKYQRSDSLVDVQVIEGAGHHVYADRPDEFNKIVRHACDQIDNPISHSKWSEPPTQLSSQGSESSDVETSQSQDSVEKVEKEEKTDKISKRKKSVDVNANTKM